MKLDDIVFEKKGTVAIATVNREERLNAFRAQTTREFLWILDEVESDNDLRVLVITGQGRAFCAGEDLKELDALLQGQNVRENTLEHLADLQTISRRLVRLSKVSIAAVNGIAVGLGAEIAIACDIRFLSEKATFAFSEVKRALFETNGVMYLLPRLVGRGVTMDWMLSGETISAAEALSYGLATKVFPVDELLPGTESRARTIAANAPISLRLVKEVLGRSYELDLESVMELEVEGMMTCLASEDMKEGVRAFVEKRPPSYRGI